MKFNLSKIFIAILTLTGLYSCNPINPDFSFSPEMPKAGQKVTFTNLTSEEVEYWNWTYDDGGYSIIKSPTHVFTKPGVYDVTLRADSNDNYVKTKQITVYDTVPSIYVDNGVKIVDYYTNADFSVLVYNPYSHDVTYSWKFSANAHSEDIVNGISDDAELTVYFSERNVVETVTLDITVGDSAYSVSKEIFIRDVKSRSMLMAQKDGKIIRQRIFDNGVEAPTQTNFSSGKHPFTIQALANQLYIFDAGTHVADASAALSAKPGDGNIRLIDMGANTSTEIVNNNNAGALHGFYSGYVDATHIYWTDFSDFVYKTAKNTVIGNFDWKGDADLQTSVPYYLVKVNRLGYFGNGLSAGQMNGGFMYYDFVYFWAKGGSGKGIYTFTKDDILNANVSTSTPPSTGAILTDFAIRAFDIDHINQKIYFSVTAPADKIGFWVANMSGSNPVRIDAAPMDDPALFITGIRVDNVSNRVYWAYRAPAGLSAAVIEANPAYKSGVKSVRLAKSLNVDKNIVYFAPDVEVYGIAIDEVKK